MCLSPHKDEKKAPNSVKIRKKNPENEKNEKSFEKNGKIFKKVLKLSEKSAKLYMTEKKGRKARLALT